jgi:8-amino-7-oxononanoate synthase
LTELAAKIERTKGSSDASQLSSSTAIDDARTNSDVAKIGFRVPRYYGILKHNITGDGPLGAGDLFYQNFDGLNNRFATNKGREYINFCSYNYLDLCGDERVSLAAQSAILEYGTSVSASRIVSGERPIHLELELAIANFIGTEAALVFVGGFSTNEDTISHLMAKGDIIFHDEYIHKSAQLGASLSGATAVSFRHNDLDALEQALQTRRHEGQTALIIVEGVYSMDGDVPDLPRIIELKRRYNAMLMVDEAHSIGVLGQSGRGISEHFKTGVEDVDIWMGTLSKSFASCGGYIAGKRDLIEYLRYTAPGFVYSVGLAPPMAAAAIKALQILQEEPWRVAQLHQRVSFFHQLARSAGLNIGDANPASSVLPVIIGQPEKTIWLSRVLMEKGILALPIGYPAVSKSKSRIRYFISCSHTESDIENAVDVMSNALS